MGWCCFAVLLVLDLVFVVCGLFWVWVFGFVVLDFGWFCLFGVVLLFDCLVGCLRVVSGWVLGNVRVYLVCAVVVLTWLCFVG